MNYVIYYKLQIINIYYKRVFSSFILFYIIYGWAWIMLCIRNFLFISYITLFVLRLWINKLLCRWKLFYLIICRNQWIVRIKHGARLPWQIDEIEIEIRSCPVADHLESQLAASIANFSKLVPSANFRLSCIKEKYNAAAHTGLLPSISLLRVYFPMHSLN